MTTYTYKKKWLLDRELGRHRTVPAQPVRDHIHQLREHGWTLRGIADAAQLGPTTTHVIAHGTQTTVRTLTAQRILALRPESINTRPNQDGFVPATGTRRRIRALLALGWPHTELHARSGVRTSVTLNQAGEWVTRATADAITALYNDLAMTPGPSARTRARAAKLGYAPPLAWDNIDDPNATPDHNDSPRTTGRSPVDLDEFMWLISTGEHPEQAAQRLGITLEGIKRAARRNGRDDVLTHTTPGREDAA